jgi:hypothetical protein
MTRKHSRPSYREDRGDPVRRLLAAVVLNAVKDCAPERRVAPGDRASAQAFLAGEEGEAWLRAFGIPPHKARAFAHKGYCPNQEGAWSCG